MERRLRGSIALLLFGLVVAGCSPATAEIRIVKQTVIVEVPVTVEVTEVAVGIPEPVAPGAEITVPRTERDKISSSRAVRGSTSG